MRAVCVVYAKESWQPAKLHKIERGNNLFRNIILIFTYPLNYVRSKAGVRTQTLVKKEIRDVVELWSEYRAVVAVEKYFVLGYSFRDAIRRC